MPATLNNLSEVDMTLSSYSVNEVRKTKEQYLSVMTGAYFIAGFFWVFGTVGSGHLQRTEDSSLSVFSSLIVLMVSNGIWEILTGWYADKFRRRFSISAGFFACGSGFLIMFLAPAIFDPPASNDPLEPSLLTWLVGVSVWSLGPALLSGAQEAWLVDRCNFLSSNPPENLDDVFKKAARRGVIAKAAGCLLCFFILYEDSTWRFFLSAGIAAFSSFLMFAYSRRLQEEYWTDPKYQTDESLFTFLWMGIKDLWKTPYRWFTLAFMGATSLNYILSFTVWPYLAQEVKIPNRRLYIAGGITALELMAGYFSRAFSKWIDRIEQPQWRMPIASLMYLIPVLPLYVLYGGSLSVASSINFLMVLIAASFMFRTAHTSVFGTLNAVGQQAINSDERRAVLVSMSSALAAFLVAVGLWLSYRHLGQSFDVFWLFITLPSILMLATGGYLIAHGRRS